MENISHYQHAINTNLEAIIKKHTPSHAFQEIYEYALLPAGKLFRPLLCTAIYNDFHSHSDALTQLENTNSDLSCYTSALEIHHTYTLIHDDLPAMDNDDYRRGRLSVHKKFGQWQAILAGDGLLNLSYLLQASLKNENADTIRKIFSWCNGAKGLIQGQVLDLSHEMNESIEKLIETHYLKTARLIQASLLGGYLLSQNEFKAEQRKAAWDIYRHGRSIGLLFQVIDDLTELTEDLNQHEQDVNPWLNQYDKTLKVYERETDRVAQFLKKYNLKTINGVYCKYFEKQKTTLENGWSNVNHYLKNKNEVLMPLEAIFNVARNIE